MEGTTLEFSGSKPGRITSVGPARLPTPVFREGWLKRTQAPGAKAA